MHTAKQMIPAVGQVVMVRCESWQVPMLVTDAKNAWGKVRLQVTPAEGSGSAWIEIDRVLSVVSNTQLVGVK